jgi:hypothetical protein
VGEAGAGALAGAGGRVAASGAGWAWLHGGTWPVHLTGPRGPRSPLTAVVAKVPVLSPGDRVDLDLSRARAWRTPAPAPAAAPEAIRDACDAVRAHVWNDPVAVALTPATLPDLAPRLAGRGPGLTPAGDDVLLGYLLCRRAVDPEGHRRDAALVLCAARRASGGPSLALLRWAVRGESHDAAALARDALLSADGAALPVAVRRLADLGRTTGRAILAGLAGALRES